MTKTKKKTPELSKFATFNTKILTIPEFYSDESKDWQLSLENAHFSHIEDCQFIFYVGCKESLTYKEEGFSDSFCAIMREAHELNYDYVRLTS